MRNLFIRITANNYDFEHIFYRFLHFALGFYTISTFPLNVRITQWKSNANLQTAITKPAVHHIPYYFSVTCYTLLILKFSYSYYSNIIFFKLHPNSRFCSEIFRKLKSPNSSSMRCRIATLLLRSGIQSERKPFITLPPLHKHRKFSIMLWNTLYHHRKYDFESCHT